VREVQDISTLKVASHGDVIEALEGRRVVWSQVCIDLLGTPHIERALFSFRVRVARRKKASLWRTQVGGHVVERMLGYLAKVVGPRNPECIQKGPYEQGVVIEHLLEVWYEPTSVNRVSMKATPQVVANPSCGHAAKGVNGHF
jgi:hypothetical protein